MKKDTICIDFDRSQKALILINENSVDTLKRSIRLKPHNNIEFLCKDNNLTEICTIRYSPNTKKITTKSLNGCKFFVTDTVKYHMQELLEVLNCIKRMHSCKL